MSFKIRVHKASYLLVMAAFISSCSVGPRAIQNTHVEYNRAIRRTTDEQFLLNLVRLKYREYPLFLEVSALSTQFSFSAGADVRGTINENVGGSNKPNVLGLGADVGYSDRPTVTYSPLRGTDFVQRLMSPLDLETIINLYYSGWSIARILRLTVQKVNHLENAMTAAGPTPEVAPEFDEFRSVAELLRKLQVAGYLDMGVVNEISPFGPQFEAEKIGPDQALAAKIEGYQYVSDGSGRLQLTSSFPQPYASISDDAYADPEARNWVLELYEKLVGSPLANGNGENPLRKMNLQTRIETNPDGSDLTISIVPRSLLGVLFYLSQSVDAPDKHREAGLITQTRDANGGAFDWSTVTEDLFRIHSSKRHPKDAAVSVRYRDHWFYIQDSDLHSKSTFALLEQLFSLKAGNIESTSPVLTLSVGQ